MDPFLAEIRILPFNFAPKGWASCDGQIMPITQNTALFALLGTYYGGDGRSNYALPNLQGSVPVHVGGAQPGPGLSVYDLGETGGSDTVVLSQAETPAHTHSVMAETIDPGDTKIPSPALNLAYQQVYSSANPNATMSPLAITPAGGGQPHNNLMPYLVLNFCIALAGIFPPRS